MLVSISDRLLDGGRERVAAAADPVAALQALVACHVDFALRHPALIVVQDRDWESLPARRPRGVRALQRAYVDLWAAQCRLDPGLGPGPPGPGPRGLRPDQLHPPQRAAARAEMAALLARWPGRRWGCRRPGLTAAGVGQRPGSRSGRNAVPRPALAPR